MTNIEIAKLLRKVAAAYTVLNENRFKIIAYENAATAVEHATSEAKDLFDDNKLEDLSGIGKSIFLHLRELFTMGKVPQWEKIFKKTPAAMYPLLDLPGIGPKTAFKLATTLKLKSERKAIEDLEKLAIEHKIYSIEGFGEKSEKDIIESIQLFKKGAIKQDRILINTADQIASDIILYLGKGEVLGSLRRRAATIGDIDIAVPTVDPEEIIERFINYPKKASLIEKGPTGASIRLTNGRQIDMRVVDPKQWGSMLQYFTGSKYHNIKLREFALKKGFSLSEYGIKKINRTNNSNKTNFQFDNERDLYNFLGLDYIEPELREDRGEIEASLLHKLPKLIELKDVRGDLQMHSSFAQKTSHDSGEDSVEQLAVRGKQLGYEYIAITDHNPAQSEFDEHQMTNELAKRKEYFDKLNLPIKVLSFLEVDILPDGRLPILDVGLDLLDGFLVSIHSVFNMPKDKMTDRVLKGLSHPKAKILAHPTGRLLGKREGFELDWEQIFEFCLKYNKAVEINCSPNRLDLSDALVFEAVKRGVKLSLGTDAHNVDQLDNMRYGVDVARRGWAQKENIINCLNYEKLIEWLKEEG